MNQLPQNQDKQQPNFDFITQQKAPEDGTKKKFSKKIIIIFVLVGILIVVVIVGLLSSANDNVVEETPVASSEQINQAQDVVENFLNLVNTDKTAEAYGLFSSDTLILEDTFKGDGVKFLKTLALSECTPQTEVKALLDDNGRIVRTYECPIKDDKENLVAGLKFSVDDNQGNFTINEYQLVDFE